MHPGQRRRVVPERGNRRHRLWNEKGLTVGGGLALADGKLFVMLDGGTLLVAEAVPAAYNELVRAKVLEGQCWTAPVVANGHVYCRSHRGDLVCVELR